MMDKKKQILVVGDSGVLGDRIVAQMIQQGFDVKVSGTGWSDRLESLHSLEEGKGRSDEHMGMGGKQTAMQDETAHRSYTSSQMRDTSTGNYISADKEDTSGGDIRKDESIRIASGYRENAYKSAKHYDESGERKVEAGEFRHKEWEKDESSDMSQKKSSGTSGVRQPNYATETGSFVGEYMSMYSPPIEAGEPEAGKEVPGYQTIMETPYNNREATKDTYDSRELVDKGGVMGNDSSASVDRSTYSSSFDAGKTMDKGRHDVDWSTAYKKIEGSLDGKEHLEGVDGLLFFGYSPTQDMSGSATKLFDAAKSKGIGHVVFVSMQGSSKKSGARHLDSLHDMEQHLKSSGLSYTILRPSFYMEHLLSDKSLSSIDEGHLDLPLSPDRPVDLVSAVDVGRVAAEAFQVPKKFNGKEIDLVADRVSMNEIASSVGQTFSKQVEYRKSEGSKDFHGSWDDHFKWMEKNEVHGDIGHAGEFLNRFNIKLTTFRDYLWGMKDRIPSRKAA